MALVLRSTKGSALTHAEMDANLSGLANGSLLAISTLLDLSNAAAGQVKFPAAQNSSTNANTLDDYEEGSWTPVLTFATPGDLSVSYGAGTIGTYTKIGRKVTATFNLATSAFTFTTASGNMLITGLPFTALTLTNHIWVGALRWGGITKANYTNVVARVISNSAQISFSASGSGQAPAIIAATDTPSAGTVTLGGSITYETG